MAEMRVTGRSGVPVDLPERASLLIEVEPTGSVRGDYERQQRLVVTLREAGYAGACGWLDHNTVRVTLT